MWKKRVEDEHTIGGVERSKIAPVVQVKRHGEARDRRTRERHRPQCGSQAGVLTQAAECQRHEEEEIGSRRQRQSPHNGRDVAMRRSDKPPHAEQDVDRVGHIPNAGDDFIHHVRAEREDEPRQLQR